jgi:signal transduction histidine kinase
VRATSSPGIKPEDYARLIASQRQFLQDASHQLRTPITIALGHAELLASELSGQHEAKDIAVIIGELTRLRRIAERLLMIAAAEDPEFLHPEPVALDGFVLDLLHRWRPTADRRWLLGRLDKITVRGDRDRLSMAMDALLENAVRHTVRGDVIKLSLITGPGVRMGVADAGSGMPADLLPHVFDRFRVGDLHGTGLGLALVRAVARAHGGGVVARSLPGSGSNFELLLPSPAGSRQQLWSGVARGERDNTCRRRPGPQPSRSSGTRRPGTSSGRVSSRPASWCRCSQSPGLPSPTPLPVPRRQIR